jgi:hypothetical protein
MCFGTLDPGHFRDEFATTARGVPVLPAVVSRLGPGVSISIQRIVR